MIRSSKTCWLVLATALLSQRAQASWSDVFADFYGEYNDGFQAILHQNCSSQYSVYLRHLDGDTIRVPAYRPFRSDPAQSVHDVVNCILEATPEVIKSKMATADVILGLLPSILAMVGVEACDTAVIAVVAQKPLLTLLLAFGSPAVNAHRTVNYKKALEELTDCSYGGSLDFFDNSVLRMALQVMVYFLACCSIANVAELSWELGGKVVFLLSPDDQWLVFLWAFLGLMVHVLATLALYCLVRVRRETAPQELDTSESSGQIHAQNREQSQSSRWKHRLAAPIRALLNEFQQNSTENRISVYAAPDSLSFLGWAWITAIYTTMHIIFGTALFASTLFISIGDTLGIVGRLIGSAILCRVLVKIELLLLGLRMKRSSGYEQGMSHGQFPADQSVEIKQDTQAR